jgi:hypothetical protein
MHQRKRNVIGIMPKFTKIANPPDVNQVDNEADRFSGSITH